MKTHKKNKTKLALKSGGSKHGRLGGRHASCYFRGSNYFYIVVLTFIEKLMPFEMLF